MHEYQLIGLKNGAYYQGEQLTSTNSFRIDMKVDIFDPNQDFICGTFQIYNLTKRHDLLTTYFEGELIGKKNTFTKSDLVKEDNDVVHWSEFPEWKPEFIFNPLSYNHKTSNFVYLRIKELFLLPDPKIKSIPGASIDGFYYCCYYKEYDCFTGFYYYQSTHSSSTQHIVLEKVNPKQSQSFDIR